MGSSHAPPPIDFRIERCIRVFEVPNEKIEELWRIFLLNDRNKKGIISIDDFLTNIVDYPRSPLTDSLPGLIELKSEAQMNFGEFVEMVCTICCFEDNELLKYMFYVLDNQRTGNVNLMELKHLLLAIHSGDRGLIRDGVEFLEIRAMTDPTFNFYELSNFRQKYPYAFQPLFRLQTQVITNTLGVYWWETHKLNKDDVKKAKLVAERAQHEQEEQLKRKEESVASDDVIRKRLGVRYYLMPWLRSVEEKKLLRIAAIEDEFDRETKRL